VDDWKSINDNNQDKELEIVIFSKELWVIAIELDEIFWKQLKPEQ